MKKKWHIKNRKGSVLVIALVLLALLSLLGMTTTDTSIIERKTAVNNQTYVSNFYKAEGAAREGLQRLLDDIGSSANLSWITDNTVNMEDVANWEDSTNCEPSQIIGDGGLTRYAVKGPVSGYENITPGATEDMTKGAVRVYLVYGYYNQPNPSQKEPGRALIELGYCQKTDVD